jgi:2-dehydropantoate 2-reductase
MGAVTRAPIGVFRSQPGTRQMLERTISEIYYLARARNITLPKDIIGKTMEFLDSMPPDGTASMQRDIMNGRPSELEAQNGAVVRMGQQEGVETPINAFIYYSLLPMEMRARGDLQFGE